MYVGDKPGGIWLSPTSRLVTGGFLNPCVWPSIHLLWYHDELQRCCGQTKRQGLELVCPTLDVKSQAFPGLFLYRYMDIGIPPSTIVLPRVQPPRLPKFPKGLSLDPTGRLCATFGTFGILTIFPVPPDTGPVW